MPYYAFAGLLGQARSIAFVTVTPEVQICLLCMRYTNLSEEMTRPKGWSMAKDATLGVRGN
jgi:hypothetical protein